MASSLLSSAQGDTTMIPDVTFDMTGVLIPFAAGCVAFVGIVFVALLGAMISRHSRHSAGVDLGRALPRPRRSRRATATA
jgi:hypothetical protein